FSDRAGVSGIIDGKAGTNTLDYSADTTRVYVNLLTGIATGTGGIANFHHVTGGQGNDILVGDNSANVLNGQGGRNLIIGEGGADTLTAGSGGDILIAGGTSYDTNDAALAALLETWSHTGLTYAGRTVKLKAGIAYTDNTGVHIALVDPTTVFGDS